MLRGKQGFFHLCIGPWKLYPSGKWLNESSLTTLSLQVYFIALLSCSFSRTARFTAHPTSWGVVCRWRGLGLMQIWGLDWNIRQEAIFLLTIGQQWVIWSNEREKNYRNWSSRKYREKRKESISCLLPCNSSLHKPCIHYFIEMYIIPISTIFVGIAFIFVSLLWDRGVS